MLVLDNCEHVVDAAARMAEALLRANPMARVIATSREPLRAEGEWVYLVPTLAVPPEERRDGDDPLSYGAVRLFDERARAAAPTFCLPPSAPLGSPSLPPSAGCRSASTLRPRRKAATFSDSAEAPRATRFHAALVRVTAKT